MRYDVLEQKVEELASKKAQQQIESTALAEELKDAVVERLTVIISSVTEEQRVRTFTEMHSSGYDIGTYVVYEIFVTDPELRALRTLMYKTGVNHRQLVQLLRNRRILVPSSHGTSEEYMMNMFNNNSIMLSSTT